MSEDYWVSGFGWLRADRAADKLISDIERLTEENAKLTKEREEAREAFAEAYDVIEELNPTFQRVDPKITSVLMNHFALRGRLRKEASGILTILAGPDWSEPMPDPPE